MVEAGSGRQEAEVAMFEDTRVMLVLSQATLDRARVSVEEAMTRLTSAR